MPQGIPTGRTPGNSPPQTRRGGARRRGGVDKEIDFLDQHHPYPSSAEEGSLIIGNKLFFSWPDQTHLKRYRWPDGRIDQSDQHCDPPYAVCGRVCFNNPPAMETDARWRRRTAVGLNRTRRRMNGRVISGTATDDRLDRLGEAARAAIRTGGSAVYQVWIDIVVVTHVCRRSGSAACCLIDVAR